MKKIVLIIAAAALLAACNNSTVKNDRNFYAVNCLVQEISVSSDTLEAPYTARFNELGQVTEVITTDWDGVLRFHETYTYNSDNQLEEIMGINGENENEIRYEYEHDGRFIRECRTYGMNNQEMQRWVHTNNRRHIVKTEFYQEGELAYVTTKKFKGDSYTEQSVTPEGEVIGTASVEYFRDENKPSRIITDEIDVTIEYNEQGLPVMSRGVVLNTKGEMMWVGDLDDHPSRYYSYEYDGRGNWVTRYDSYEPDGTAYAVFRRSIIY